MNYTIDCLTKVSVSKFSAMLLGMFCTVTRQTKKIKPYPLRTAGQRRGHFRHSAHAAIPLFHRLMLVTAPAMAPLLAHRAPEDLVVQHPQVPTKTTAHAVALALGSSIVLLASLGLYPVPRGAPQSLSASVPTTRHDTRVIPPTMAQHRAALRTAADNSLRQAPLEVRVESTNPTAVGTREGTVVPAQACGCIAIQVGGGGGKGGFQKKSGFQMPSLTV